MAMIGRRWTGVIAARLVPIIVLTMVLSGSTSPSHAESDRYIERAVTQHIQRMLPAGEPGGAAVAVRTEGRVLFFNYGLADFASKRSITPDTLFNLASLRKVFEATLLAQAVRKGDLSLDDRASKYVTELQQGGDISRVTLGHSRPTPRGCCCRRTIRPGRTGATRCRSSSARSTRGERISSPASRTSIPMPAISCCSSRSSADMACRSTC